jgi:hypothetical protein
MHPPGNAPAFPVYRRIPRSGTSFFGTVVRMHPPENAPAFPADFVFPDSSHLGTRRKLHPAFPAYRAIQTEALRFSG